MYGNNEEGISSVILRSCAPVSEFAHGELTPGGGLGGARYHCGWQAATSRGDTWAAVAKGNGGQLFP